MSSTSTTQTPSTTQIPTNNNNLNDSDSIETSKKHIYILPSKKQDVINKQIIYNIDLPNNKIPLKNLNSKITESPSNNVMINLNPFNTNDVAYLHFDINNKEVKPFSGSFYVSLNTDMFTIGDGIDIREDVYLCTFGSGNILNDIIISIVRTYEGYYIEFNKQSYIKIDNSFVETVDYKKLLTFLVSFRYVYGSIEFVINDKDTYSTTNIDSNEVIGVPVQNFTLQYLTFAGQYDINKYGKLPNLGGPFSVFNTKMIEKKRYNAYIGGIKFYNDLKDFAELRNLASFKSIAPVRKTETNNSDLNTITTTTTKPPIKSVPIIKIPQYKSDLFTNYSPSAELFKNIQY